MSKKTKLILSIIGLAAVIIPVLLLLFLTGRASKQAPDISSEKREIDTKNIEEAVRKAPKPQIKLPSASGATGAASPKLEGSPSAQ